VASPGTKTLRRCAGIAAFAACALVWAPAPALGAIAPPGAGVLSPRLAELAKPALRSAPPAVQAKALSVAVHGPGSLLRDGNRVLVEARFDHDAAASVDALRAAGAAVVNVSRRYRTVTVAAKPDELTRLDGVPRLAAAREVLRPITASTCPSGEVVSEGLLQLRAGEGEGEARQVFGVDGGGVTVGILSDSFDRAAESVENGPLATHAAEDVEAGELPGSANTCPGQSTPVDVLDDSEAEGKDEGRAMSQIVHDLAPGADLAFATAFTGETAFAENIEALAKPIGEGGAGARVIADDVTYFEEPFFQEGPVGVAASKVTEDGVSYFSSAGNDNLIDGSGRDIASWEAPHFRDSGSCPAAIVTLSEEIEELEEEFFEEEEIVAESDGLHPEHCMDFNPGNGVGETDDTFGIAVAEGETLIADLQWAEPWEEVDADLDAFLIGPEGEVVAGSVADNVGEGRPFELVGWENATGAAAQVQLVINRYSGANPRLKFGLLQNGGGVSGTEYPESTGGDVVGPTIFGHNGGEDVTTVGAIRFNTTTAPERYSSRGPVAHYFGPVTGSSAPAAPLGTPEILSKPDVTATDCGVTTFFAFEVGGSWRFCGTSAAAPHAAAVAALMLDKVPGADPEEVRSGLTGSAKPVGSYGPCAVGAGLVDAVDAVGLLFSGASGTPPTVCQPPESAPSAEEEAGPSEEEVRPSAIPVAPVVTSVDPNLSPGLQPPRPPHAFLRRHPAKLIRARRRWTKAVFRFEAENPQAILLCQVDGGPFHPCPARFVRRFSVGWHAVRVKARDAAGNLGPAAVFRFRVKRVGHRRAKHRHVARRGHLHPRHRL
jgi:hypothetical protein